MNISFELVISLTALLISIHNLNCQPDKCNKRTLVTHEEENSTSNKMSCFPCGKPEPIVVIAALICAFASALIMYGIKMIFIAIGLSFTINIYMYTFCFTSMLFTFMYCDSRYFRLRHSDREKDIQSVTRFMAILSAGISVLAIAVALIMENAKFV